MKNLLFARQRGRARLRRGAETRRSSALAAALGQRRGLGGLLAPRDLAGMQSVPARGGEARSAPTEEALSRLLPGQGSAVGMEVMGAREKNAAASC